MSQALYRYHVAIVASWNGNNVGKGGGFECLSSGCTLFNKHGQLAFIEISTVPFIDCCQNLLAGFFTFENGWFGQFWCWVIWDGSWDLYTMRNGGGVALATDDVKDSLAGLAHTLHMRLRCVGGCWWVR